jgi:hypothetical protein
MVWYLPSFSKLIFIHIFPHIYFLLSFTEKKVNKESAQKANRLALFAHKPHRRYANKPAGSHLFGVSPRAAKALIF